MLNNADHLGDLAGRIRKVARRFEDFARDIFQCDKPKNWKLWIIDADVLACEAGRLLVDAIANGRLDAPGISGHCSYRIAKEKAIREAYVHVFELVLTALGVSPDDSISEYDSYYRGLGDCDPLRNALDVRVFAERRRREGEALAVVAGMVRPITSKRRRATKGKKP